MRGEVIGNINKPHPPQRSSSIRNIFNKNSTVIKKLQMPCLPFGCQFRWKKAFLLQQTINNCWHPVRRLLFKTSLMFVAGCHNYSPVWLWHSEPDNISQYSHKCCSAQGWWNASMWLNTTLENTMRAPRCVSIKYCSICSQEQSLRAQY